MRIDKEVYKYINHELQHYEENKKELERLKTEIIEQSPAPADGQPRGNTVGNPTEQKTMKLLTSAAILRIERNIRAIDKIYNQLNKEYKRFFDLCYIEQVGIVKTCNDIPISEKTYHRWRDNITYSVGMELGLL